MASILVKKVTVGTPITGVIDLNTFNFADVGNGDLLVYDSASGEFKADSDTYLKVAAFNSSSTDSAAIRSIFSASGDLSYDSASAQFSIDVEAVYTKANFDSDLGASSTTITSLGAVNAGSITSDFGNINIGSSTFTSTGTVNAGTVVATTLDISGNVDIDGTLETDGLSISSTAITATAAELNILDGVTSTATELNILDGATVTTAELNILDGVTSTAAELNILDGVTSTAAELNILDGVTATAAELSLLDGGTSATFVTVADADRIILNDNGTMKQVAMSRLNVYFGGDTTAVGALNSGSITSGFGAIDNGTSGIRTATFTAETAFVPDAQDGASLGTTSLQFSDIFLADGSVIGMGDDNEVTLTHIPDTGLRLNSTMALQFNDASQFINAPSATVLDITATDEIELNATLVDINASVEISGNLTVAGTTTQVDTVTMSAANAVVFEGATADDHETTLTIIDPNTDRTINLPNQSGTIPVLAAVSATAITSTPEELNILDGVTSTAAELNLLDGVTSTTAELNILDGVTSTAAELNKLDGATITTAELNILDGDTSAATVTLADADRVVVNDAGVMKQVTMQTMNAYMSAGSTVAADDLVVGNNSINLATTAGNITIDAREDNSDIIFKGTDGGVDTIFLTIDGSAAGAATFNDKIVATELDISGNVDIDGTLETDAFSINGTAVTSTAAELNILDGVTSDAGELNILDGVTSTAAELNILDGVTSTAAELNILDGVTSDAAELNILDGVTASAADINLIDGITNGTVIASKAIVTDANIDITGGRNITISGELDAATLDISGDADIDGTLEADAITIGGVTLAETISDTVGAMVSSNTETNITVTYQDADNTLDFVIGTLNQNTTGSAATLTTARTIHGVSFDGSANIDLSEVVSDTVGAMVGSNTETGIAVTYQDGDNTIDFALDAAQTTITSLLAADIKIGEDDETKIDFETADEIHFYAANAHQVKLVDGALVPVTDNDIDLGTSSVEFKDAFFDGTVTSDAFAGPLTGDVTGNADTATALATARTIHGLSFDGTANIDLSETISDTVGAMFSSNTETGIAVAYQDGDNTIDLALSAAQTTITSLLATDIKIGEDDQTKIDFETADTINFYAGNEKQLILTDGALTPGADNILDLGSSGVEFKDAYFDGTVTSDAFAGPLTGNVTGNASGTAATVTGAAQSAITSLGTLTALTVDNLGVNGNTITANSGALNLTPASGSAIVLDGTINVDAGVVTGATSITSTAFVGNVTGNASGTALTVTQAAQSAITSVGTLTVLTVDDVVINGATIGHGDDTDLMTVADGILTVAGEISVTTLDIGGTDVTSTAAELNALDGVTAVVGELNALDLGSTAVGTAIASKAVILDSNKDYTGVRNLTISGELDAGSLDISGDADIDGTLETDALSINGTAVTSTAAELNILDGVTSTAAELNILDGVTSDAGELNILDGVTSTAAELNILDGVTSTAAEINLIDGGTSRGTTAVADGDGFLTNDGGTMRMTSVDTLATYMSAKISGGGAIVATGALNSGTITSGFGNIDTGASTITTTGAVATGALTAGGILKTDDATEATSTTDGSLQTDGGLSVAKDIVAGDDIKLLSDASVIALGADGDVTLTHVADTGILLNSTMAIQFNDASQFINAPSNAILDINATDEIELNATLVDINANVEISGNLTVSGTTTQVDTVTMEAANAVVFEGATADDHETTLTIIDPTADRTQRLINQSGFIPLLAAVTTTAITSTPAELNILDGVTSTAAELNILDGVTSTAAELNILDGVTSTAAELNILDGVTSTATELNLIDGSSANSVVNSKAVIYGSSGELAGVLSTAGQTNITSLGTLSALTVDSVVINGATIGHGDDTDLLTVADGIVTVAGEISVTTLDIGGTNVSSTAAELNILDGVTSTAAELNILDGVTSTAAELNILDGVTSTAGEINLIDGGTARGTTAVADGDGILINDAGTMRMTTVQTVSAYMAAEGVGGANVVTTGALNSGSITSGFGNIDNGSSTITTTGAVATGALTAGGILKTDDTTAATSTTDGSLQTDGGLSVALDAVVGDDIILISDASVIHFGANKDVNLTHVADAGLTLNVPATGDNSFPTFTLAAGDNNIAANDVLGAISFIAPAEGAGTDAIAVAASIQAISEGDFSASNNATKLSFRTGASEAATEKMTLSSDGKLTIGDGKLVLNSTAVTSTAAELNILDGVTSTAAELNILDGVTSTAAELNILDGVTSTAAELNIMDGVTSTAAELNALDGITAVVGELNALDIGSTAVGTAVASKAVILDSNKDYTGVRNFTVSGELDAATGDFSGNVDVDGTLEADAITVNGTALAEVISDTAGAMFSSNTETGIAATYQDGDNTIDLAINAAQTTITSILATDVKIGEDDQTKIDFETANEIHFYAANAHQIKLVDGALVPVTDNDIDLGTTSLEFKNAFFDGTVTSDAFAGPLTGDVTGNADTATVLATARTINGTSFNGSANITLGTGSVTHAMLAADCIDGDNIGNDVINSEHYAAGSIDNEHIADDAINSEHYAAGSIDRAHLAADIIDGTKIADDVINSEHYAAGSIDNEHIADDAINSEHYAAGSIDTAHIANAQVTGAKIAADTVAEANMANDAISSVELKSLATLLILNEAGNTVRTFHCAGA